MEILEEIFGFEEHVPLSYAAAVSFVRVFLIAAQVGFARILWRRHKLGAAAVGAGGLALLAFSGLFNVDTIVFDIPREPFRFDSHR